MVGSNATRRGLRIVRARRLIHKRTWNVAGMHMAMDKSSPRRRFWSACILTGASSLGLMLIPLLPRRAVSSDALVLSLVCALAVLTAVGAIVAVFSLKQT